jgi:hypothetical protein
MNNYLKIGKKETLDLIKEYVEANYGYQDVSTSATAYKGYQDVREYEAERVEFTVKGKKDLGLGIGKSELTIVLTEKDAEAIILQKLANNDIEGNDVVFENSDDGDYFDRGGLSFNGVKVSVNLLERQEQLKPGHQKIR